VGAAMPTDAFTAENATISLKLCEYFGFQMVRHAGAGVASTTDRNVNMPAQIDASSVQVLLPGLLPLTVSQPSGLASPVLP